MILSLLYYILYTVSYCTVLTFSFSIVANRKLVNIILFFNKQPVYKQLWLDLQKVKQLLGLKHVTISNFANKIFAYENIATTLHNHIL